MNASHVGPAAVGPPHGAVLITRVEGSPVRYQLSLVPSAPGVEVVSATAAWSLARRFAASRGVEVWFTSDGVSHAHAPQEPPWTGAKERRQPRSRRSPATTGP